MKETVVTAKKQNNLGFITFAYAIGALFVVLGHSTPTSESDMPIFIDSIRTFIYAFHMPLFFFIAGVLLQYTTSLKGQKPYGSFMKNKVIKFLVPYFVLTVVGFIPKLLLANFVNDDVSSGWFYIVKVIFNPRQNVWGHFWFLPTLLLMYAVSYIILFCAKNKFLKAMVLSLVIVIALFPIKTQWFALNDFCLQFTYFCMGIFFSGYIISNRTKLMRLPIAIVSLCFSIAVFYLTYSKGLWVYPLVRNSSSLFIAIFMIYFVMYLSVILESRESKAFKWLDGKTFTIYILSWPCQAIAEILLNRVLHLPWYITLTAMFLVGLFIPLFVIYIYKKLNLKCKFVDLVFGLS